MKTFSIDLEPSGLSEPQQDFLYATERNVLLSGGFGAGKTTAGVFKFYQLMGANPGVPGLVLAHNWSVLKGVVLRGINLVLPPKLKRRIIDPQGERYITFDGRTPIYMRSADKPSSVDSYDVGWVWGDELRHYKTEAYHIAIARCRIPCALPQRAWTSTPNAGLIADEFDSDIKERRMIIAPTRTNIHNLAPGFIDDLEGSYGKRMRRAFLDGQITMLEGAVYEAFDGTSEDSPWLVDYDIRQGSQNETLLMIDPGYRRPAVIWARHTPEQGNKLVWTIFHQAMPENLSTVRLAEMVNDINDRLAIWVDQIWVDPAADAKSQADETSVVMALRNIRTRKRNPIRRTVGAFASIGFGIERLRAMLGDPEEDLPIRLRFARRLVDMEKRDGCNKRGVLKSLQSYRYPEIKDGRATSDIPEKDGTYDHACDALRYGAVGLTLTTELRASTYETKDTKRTGVRVG